MMSNCPFPHLNPPPSLREGGGNGKILILSLSLRKGEEMERS